MTRLALDLAPRMVEILDSVARGDLDVEPDDRTRREAVVKLLVDHAARREEPGAVRRERDALRKALEAERATRRRDRERYAAGRRSLRNAIAATERLRESRARYRGLALRIEAALLRSPPRDDFDRLEQRLGRALAAAGFEMPAAPDLATRPATRPSARDSGSRPHAG
ncbi:MAG: hypothetical protein OXH15_05340 [Gammaproteobacteria bacterium]|nr:hypothetical protein [Gammaproteobacteria bacterium]